MTDLAKFFAGVSCMDTSNVTPIDPTDLFDADGVLMPMPASFWESKTREQKMLFGHKHALYSFVTTDLVAELHQIIAGRKAIEIGAGNGGIARALAIPATDSHQQSDPQFAALYDIAGQPTINYGPHVEKLEASLAIATYQPEIVIGAWVTHLYDPYRHELGGNVVGINEHAILDTVDEYIFIGNTAVHASKPLFEDITKGRITSHRIKEYHVGVPMLQSRRSRGVDFIIRLGRV